MVLEYVRWVMVRKRDKDAPAPEAVSAASCRRASIQRASAARCRSSTSAGYDFALAGSPYRWGDYEVGEKIDHVDGMTLEEAEHQIATRLYQNTAKVHFNQHTEAKGRFGKRIVYGGVVISLARALSFNGLDNAFHLAAINGGRHVAPCFAGDTVYAWSEVLEKAELPGRKDVGALRIRLVGGEEPGLRRLSRSRRQTASTTMACCSTSTPGCCYRADADSLRVIRHERSRGDASSFADDDWADTPRDRATPRNERRARQARGEPTQGYDPRETHGRRAKIPASQRASGRCPRTCRSTARRSTW